MIDDVNVKKKIAIEILMVQISAQMLKSVTKLCT